MLKKETVCIIADYLFFSLQPQLLPQEAQSPVQPEQS